VHQAKRLFEQATTTDPTCAVAWLGLAQTYERLVYGGPLKGPDPVYLPRDGFPKAAEYTRKALELDASLATAHALLANLATNYEYDWATAEQEYKRALALGPTEVTVRQSYALFLAKMGRYAQARTEAAELRRLAPESGRAEYIEGITFYLSRDFDEAIERFRSSHGGKILHGAQILMLSYIATKQYEEVVKLRERFGPAVTPPDCAQNTGLQTTFFLAEARIQPKDTARNRLLALDACAATTRLPYYRHAAAWLALGDKEKAMDFLALSLDDRNEWNSWLKTDPVWDDVRNHPRFQQLIARMKFPK
jgi:hypothetical protein